MNILNQIKIGNILTDILMKGLQQPVPKKEKTL